MNVYRIHYMDPRKGSRVRWARNRREASAALRAMHEESSLDGRPSEWGSIQPTYVPTKKPQLIAWLNVRCNHDG